MLLKELGQKTRHILLEFLWDQWTQLGVAGSSVYTDNRIVDPEALLLFTAEIGRYDPRLFDEVIDWCMRNERWLSLQRLKNMAESWGSDRSTRTIVAIASMIYSLEKKHRWHTVSRTSINQLSEPNAFFLDMKGDPLPLSSQQDGFFAKAGLIRPPVVVRGLSIRVPMNSKPALIFRLRSLFGLGPRAEVVAYLLTHDSANVSGIAQATGYSRPPVQDTLNDLVEGRFVQVYQRRNTKMYSIDSKRWEHILETGEVFPDWVEWSHLFRALIDLMEFFIKVEKDDFSDYMLRSLLLSLNNRMRNELAETSFQSIFAGLVDLTSVLDEFEQRIVDLIANLR